MDFDSDQWYFATDAGASISESNDGVTHDDDGVSFEWDDVPTVDASEVPQWYREFFDADAFHRLETTVVRPIEQKYVRDGDVYTFKKPADELKSAQWSMDNSPLPLTHPDNGAVASTDDVRGFWRRPTWHDGTEAALYFPMTDEELKDFLSRHGDVSVGFYNRLVSADEDGVDAYQTDIIYDHVAAVKRGRCSGENGCGFDADSGHGHVRMTAATNVSQPDGVAVDQSEHTHEGSWYAVPPDDNPDDEWKFPIDNCSDVDDAWHLRGHGDISISQSTLEDRIRQRARDLGCDVPTEDAAYDGPTTDSNNFYTHMTDGCTCGGDGDFDAISEMNVDAIADRNENVEQIVEDKRDLEQTVEKHEDAADALDALRSTLDVDDDTDVVSHVSELKDERDEYEQTVEDYESDRRDELVERISDHMDYDADELAEFDVDRLEDIEEVGEKAGAFDDDPETSPTTANGGTTTDSGGDEPDEDAIYETAY